MSKKNIECKLKYCSECGLRLHQENCREELEYIVLTRKCPQCKKKVYIVEVSKIEYNTNVEVLNKIIDLLAQKKDTL
jgi:hypothetical protein